MGPTILLDKCALQSLGREEINSLASTFCVNAPPILIEEIVADLKKSKGLMKDARHEVEVLARKLRACLGSIYINVHYRVLCEGEVLGYEVKMDRLTLIGGGKRVMLPE
ncbi:MAG: hypothetical protein HZA91_08170, partial [Verrucomicrobia bacterium]|nr:hypothetical protein [Verrucomicrobiota bacterium]